MNDKKQPSEQNVAEDFAAAEEQGSAVESGSEVNDIAKQLEEKDNQIDEINNRLLRLQADFDNYRRRAVKEKEELSQIVGNGVITKLLPVLDNFDRALATAPGQDGSQLLTGVEMVYRQLTQILEGMGVKKIPAVDCQFDPALHEAIMRVEDGGKPDGLIVEELQKGYINQDKVLRPSMVKVVNNN